MNREKTKSMSKRGDRLNEFLERKACPHNTAPAGCVARRAYCGICWNEDVAEFERHAFERGIEAGNRHHRDTLKSTKKAL